MRFRRINEAAYFYYIAIASIGMDITFIKSFLATGSKKDFMQAAIVLDGIITFAFVVSSFVVAGTANAGFNCVLTGFLNIAFTAGAYYVIENSKSPIAVT